MQTLLTFLQKQATLIRRSTVLSLPLQLVFPAFKEVNYDLVKMQGTSTFLASKNREKISKNVTERDHHKFLEILVNNVTTF